MRLAPPDPTRLASAARSILACPDGVSLVVEGVDDVLGDLPAADDLGMQDLGGVPTFSCPPGLRLCRAAQQGRRALLTVESGLGAPGTTDRNAVLSLGGHLEWRGLENCTCCSDTRETLVLVVDLVVLTRPDTDPYEPPVHVPVEHFRSPEHLLNRGYLQRSAEHANACHQEELRAAVAATTASRIRDVIGVSLGGLSPTGVDIHWITPEGAHVRHLAFGRTARTTAELGDLLRRELHAGLC